MAEPSAEVVRRAQRGDEEALVELVTGQQRYVYSIALRMLGNPTDAADVTQESVVRLLRSLGTYRGETRFTTWLYRIVVNLALDALRRRGPVPTSMEGDEWEEERHLDPPDLDPAVDPEIALGRAVLGARLEGALNLLTPMQRAALTMCYVEDLTYEEIAEVLQVPVNTVKSHIRRAKLHMARILGTTELNRECPA
jgi:RNA polymerase sigma-70 factor (ECF subfamily)